jgi:HEAT repeat protein
MRARRVFNFGILVLAACGTYTANIESSDPYEQYLWLIQLNSGAGESEMERVRQAAGSNAALAREGAVRAVGNIGKPDLIPIAMDRLGDSDPNVRMAAIESLAKLKIEAAQTKILEKLRVDSEVQVRRTAAKSLREFTPNRAAYQDLIAALEDKDGGVSVLAQATLEKLSGQTMARTDVKGWQEWLAKTHPQ